ncbi:MAG: co-chaperone GroES [Rickettsiales bacterium]|nr:co-chaperone GroES [Rickettsiales bacterium]
MLNPLHNYVLLERLEEQNTTVGGILIPDNAKEKPVRGKVVACGPGVYDDGILVPLSVRVNDTVLFAKWASSASEIKLDGKEYIIIKETDILGIL